MKRMITALIGVLIGIWLTGCGANEIPEGNQVQIYYLNTDETKVEMHEHRLESEETEDKLDEIMQYLGTNPEKLEYKAPLAMGFQVLDLAYEEGKVSLDVNMAYSEMPVTTEVLVRAALVRTLTQLEEVKYVSMTVEGNQLFDGAGNLVGVMSAEQFIDNDGSEINTYELARVKLYFASEDGNQLIAAYREKHYSTNTSMERFVVEELIAGPSGQIPGLYPSINPATKIINVMTKDGICYVNMDENFLTVVNNVSIEDSIYSIVNSLVELSNINKVQILINGEVPSSFQTPFFERNLDIVTILE